MTMTATGTTSAGRRFGVALIGFLIGALGGFMLHEIIAVIILAITGTAFVATTGIGMFLFYLTPIGAVAGLLLALRIDTRRRHARAGGR